MAIGKIVLIGSLGLAISGCSTFSARNIDTLPPTAALPVTSQSGIVELRYFNDISVASVNDMMQLSRYPDNPDEIVELSTLEVLQSRDNTYGSLVRGYIVPKASGSYRFFVSGDDEAQFALSTTSSAVDLTVIASAPGWTSRNQFDRYSSQKSGAINLEAGQKYYFEIRHREGYGGDHFSVAWEGPGFARSVITGEFLSSLGQESQLYSSDELAVKGYGLGYRIGFFDGKNAISYSPSYPPLDENQDGLYDNWATYYGLSASDTNAVNIDQDGDLLSTFDEFWLGTEPNNIDTDGDGISDGEEFAFGLNPLDSADSAFDLDGDGFTNLEESRAGTDMTNPADMPEQEDKLVAGVIGQYFVGREFNTFILTRLESGLTYDWAGGSPAKEIPTNVFSARWSGYLVPSHGSGTREHEFRIKRDDGVRLYINGNLEFEAWNGSVDRVYTHTVSLPADEPTPFTLEYKEGYGNARISVEVVDQVTGEIQKPENFYKTLEIDSSSTTDTDADGIPDVWETKHGLNPSSADSGASSNNSGVSNLQAYQSGLSPWDLEVVSSPAAPDLTPPSGGVIVPEVPPVSVPATTTISWTAPSTRVNGVSIALSEIASYEVRYGRSEDKLDASVNVSSENTSYIFTDLEKGEWYFNVQAVDQKGLHSTPSDTVSHIIR